MVLIKVVDWMPLDAIGQTYVDWVVSTDDLPKLVNVVHPRPTTWDVILQGLRWELGYDITVVPLEQWVAKLEKHGTNPTTEDLENMVWIFSSSGTCREGLTYDDSLH